MHDLLHRARAIDGPIFQHHPRWHSERMEAMLCDTTSTVRPCRATSPIFPRHFFWNAASPTASTSSTSRISGSRCAATANASRSVHPARVTLHRRIDEILHLRERDNLIEFPRDLRVLHPENRPVEINIVPPAQLRVKTGPHLQQRRHSPPQDRPAFRRLGNPGKDLSAASISPRRSGRSRPNHLSRLHGK